MTQPEPVPSVLADAEVAEVSPEIERAISEGAGSIARDELIRLDSDAEFEAFLAGVAWHSPSRSAAGE